MSAKIIIHIYAIASCLFSLGVLAQELPTLKEAVRDQYIEVFEEEALNKLDDESRLSDLDGFSHLLSEKELTDTSQMHDSEAFVQEISAKAVYLRIPVFHVKTATQVHLALSEALKNTYMKSIVIDLRGNRGGLLNAAIEVADEFISNGVIASTKGRQDASNLVFLAKPGGLAEGQRIAVLLDNKTASSAELLAGVLSINANAILIGQRSFGKSAVQTQIQLKNGDALSLTTASYYFSDGTQVPHDGLVLDKKISSWTLKRYPPLTQNSVNHSDISSNSLLRKVVNELVGH